MQETKSITLPVTGKVVIIKGYMTGYIDQEIQTVLLGANVAHYQGSNQPGAEPTLVLDTDPTAQIKADAKMLELMVLSIDGKTTDILDTVLSLPKDDVDFIKEQLKSVEASDKLTDEEEKKA